MNPVDKWNDYWFAPAPAFDLALVRIILAGLQVFLLLSAAFNGLQAVMALPDALFAPNAAFKTLMWPWGWGVRPDDAMVMTVFWIAVVAGVLAVAGLATNASLFVLTLGSLYTQAYIYSFEDFHHGEAVMMVALLALSLSPAGRTLSLDRLLQDRVRGRPSPAAVVDERLSFAGWPLRLMQWFVPLMYLSAVASKLSASGLEWANGYTLQYYLILDGVRLESQLALWAAQHHVVILLLQWAVLVFQATFFLILFFPRLKWIYIPAGLSLHLGIYLTLQAPFPEWIAMYAVYIPWSRAIRRLAGPARAGPAHAADHEPRPAAAGL